TVIREILPDSERQARRVVLVIRHCTREGFDGHAFFGAPSRHEPVVSVSVLRVQAPLHDGVAAIDHVLPARRVARDFPEEPVLMRREIGGDRKSTRLNSSHVKISYAVFCLKKKRKKLT